MQEATRQRLAKNLGIAPSYLAKIVSGITKIANDTYIRARRLHLRSEGRSVGPPRVYYELIGERFVTFPETAYLLLQLLASPRDIPRRINIEEFIERTMGESALSADRIRGRIRWAVRNEYLDEDGLHIEPRERIVLERPYLELLAGHFNVPSLVRSVLSDTAQA